MEPTEAEWAYLAGIIDGEGSIVLSHRGARSSNSYECCVSVVNTDFNLIDWINGTFGCHIYLDERGSNPNSNRYGHKPIHRAAWHGKEDIYRILSGVLPYLIIKHAVAEVLITFASTPIWEKEVRIAIKNKLSEVKQNG